MANSLGEKCSVDQKCPLILECDKKNIIIFLLAKVERLEKALKGIESMTHNELWVMSSSLRGTLQKVIEQALQKGGEK